MCPDKVFLSAYYDNELSPDAVNLLKTHLADCETCQKKLESFGRISNILQESEISAIDSRKQMIWNVVSRTRRRKRNAWRRKLQIPMPVAAGFGVLFLAFATFSGYKIGSGFSNKPPVFASESSNLDVIPIQDNYTVPVDRRVVNITFENAEEFLRFIENNADIEVSLQLQVNPDLQYQGDALLLKEQEYRGR